MMTRINEPDFDANEIPDYKSPPSRIIRSLRKAYDNLRMKLDEKAKLVQSLKGKLRDTQESRDEWKERAKAAELKNLEIIKKNEEINENLKKNTSSSRFK
jgi:uncharacterized coiled-coil DUF342 family protein